MNVKADALQEDDVTTTVDQGEIDEQDPPVNNDDQQDGDTGEDLVVTIGEDAPPPEEDVSRAPNWVKDVRRQNRELVRKTHELEAKLKQYLPSEEVTLGKKPVLEDYEWDAAKFTQALDDWYARKQQLEVKQREQQTKEEREQAAWQAKLNAYEESKAKLAVEDYEEAESFIKDTFSVTQQAVIVKSSKNPAQLVYVLSKYPSKAKEFASITDPVEFAWAMSELETKVKVDRKNGTTPRPESIPSGSGTGISSTTSSDAKLDKLRAEAERTGDYSKVVAYKKQRRDKS